MRVLFILPGEGGGGGAHSVVQEGQGLRRLGVEAALATTADTLQSFRWHYPELSDQSLPVQAFATAEELRAHLADHDLAVATTAPSAHLLAAARGAKPKGLARPAYYIQDYEPLFRTPGAARWDEARASFDVLGEALLFAKTDWLRRIVYDNHARPVAKVQPSIDHAVYRPGPRPASERPVICAMVRPKTPRRGPKRTLRMFERLAARYGDKVELIGFGAAPEDYDRIGMRSDAFADRGVLRRHEVAEVLRGSDLFLDLSDYQAFGRTGLEAMACGCTPLLPVFGGADEYARHWTNAILADTRSDEAVMAAVDAFIAADPDTRRRLRDNGVATALDFTVEKAAFSEYRLFAKHLGRA